MHPVTVENDASAWKSGRRSAAKVSSIIDKADHYELLFNYPAELPDSPHYDAPTATTGTAGWDECFPAVAPSKYPRHPYNGIAVPDHGELWGIPTTTAVPTEDGITTVWHGLRFGYRLTRKLFLRERPIVAEYDLTNLAPFEFPDSSGRCASADVDDLSRLSCKAAADILSAGATNRRHGNRPFDRIAPGERGESRTSPTRIAASRRGWKVFSTEPIQIADPHRISRPASAPA